MASTKCSVYRTGLLTPAADLGAAEEVTAYADSLRPKDGRCGRKGSLFATVTVESAVRWVRGNDMCNYDTRVTELKVNPDTVFVYAVDLWERVDLGKPETVARYWASGVTLTAWLATHGDCSYEEASAWEVLFEPTAVLSTRPVSAKRLLAHTPTAHLAEVRRILKRTWR